MECHDCSCSTDNKSEANRVSYVKQAKRLALMTIGWNLIEGIAALVLGGLAGSVALLGFGFDSVIETASAAVVGFRFWREEKDDNKNEALEHKAAKIVGMLLFCLAACVVVESVRKLSGVERPAKESPFGIALTAAALIVMPLLANAKYRAAGALKSGALKAEAFQSVTCVWLAGATLLGLVLNALFHWSWADPVAALLFIPAILKEAMEAMKGELCSDCG